MPPKLKPSNPGLNLVESTPRLPLSPLRTEVLGKQRRAAVSISEVDFAYREIP